MSKEITIGMEKLMAFFIIAMGETDGVSFVYYPKLPKPFCERLNIDGCIGDLLSIRVDPSDDNLSVQFWFMDSHENHFFYTWNELKQSCSTLCAIVFTHIYDMIENMEDC